MPSYQVQGLTVQAFSLQPDFSLVSEFLINVKADNPNDHIGFIYGKDNSVVVAYEDSTLSSGKLPSFHQGHNNATMMNVLLKGKSEFGSGLQEALMQNRNSGKIPLLVLVKVPVSLILAEIPMRHFVVFVNCSLVVDNLSPNKKIRILSTSTERKFNKRKHQKLAMPSGLRRAKLSSSQPNLIKFQAKKRSNVFRMGVEADDIIKGGSNGWLEKYMIMMELRKKIVTFRDIIDLPPCNDSDPIHELVVGTTVDLHKLYPNVVPCIPIREKTEIYEGLAHLYDALKSVRDSWAKSHKWVANFGHNADVSMENISLEQLSGILLTKLIYMIKLAREMFDVMDEDEKNEGRIHDSTFGDILTESYSDIKNTCPSPISLTSAPPLELIKLSEYANVYYSQPLLLPLRLQAMEKCLTFHKFPQGPNPTNRKRREVDEQNIEIHKEKSIKESPATVTSEGLKDYEPTKDMPRIANSNSNQLLETTKPIVAEAPPLPPLPPLPPPPTAVAAPSPSCHLALNAIGPPPPPPILQSKGSVPVPTPPIPLAKGVAPPPPPPILYSKGSVLVPPPPIPLAKGAAPPPPPPLGGAKSLRPKKANTKLKRSTQMGNLYRVLKGKVEGSNLNGRNSQGRRTKVGASACGKQGMADALAEMTKRSAYFQQIEEDVEKHAKSIMEIKGAISSFQTKDMAELLKFHKYVEQHLDKLTDETQVLARFEGFPSKKLESVRTATALYKRLETIITNLENWKVDPPLSKLLDKVECYFNKIKGEIDALERTKDEEAKRFQSHNIHFDFHILVRIKECMVDVSSSCMELALRERREAQVAANTELGPKTEVKRRAHIKMLWKAFQLAFRVYSFAGGQDDRADRLTRELAQEIETAPVPE
ncbi:unnamed protein product [Camellia sinensis]